MAASIPKKDETACPHELRMLEWNCGLRVQIEKVKTFEDVFAILDCAARHHARSHDELKPAPAQHRGSRIKQLPAVRALRTQWSRDNSGAEPSCALPAELRRFTVRCLDARWILPDAWKIIQQQKTGPAAGEGDGMMAGGAGGATLLDEDDEVIFRLIQKSSSASSESNPK